MVEDGAGAMPSSVADAVYTWQPEITETMARRERLHRVFLLGGGGALIVGGIGLAVAGSGAFSREMVVLGLMLGALGVFGLIASRSARTTVVVIDRNGVLSVSQAGKTDTVDLREVSSIGVRRRSGQPQWKWSIEAVTPTGGWHTELAPVASYWNQPEPVIEALEAELRHFLAWANPGAAPAASRTMTDAATSETGSPETRSFDTGSFSSASAAGPEQLRGTLEATPTRFAWTPPRGENAGRNRTRFRIGLAVTFVLIAGWAAASVWNDGLDSVALSMFAPLLYLLIGVGVDRAFMTGARFRLIVDPSGLTIDRGRGKTVTIPFAEIASLDVSTRTSSANAGGSSTTANHWFVTIPRHTDQPGKPAFHSMIPVGLGGAFRRDDAIILEAELRRRCGLPVA